MSDDQSHGAGPAVACEHGPGFPQAPMGQAGLHFDIAVVQASGNFGWEDGNIGGGGTPQNDLVLSYGQTFHIQGWTVVPNTDGTRFTNDGTGHGMFVSIDNVSPF
jgi:lysophospholipase L1-like esterase